MAPIHQCMRCHAASRRPATGAASRPISEGAASFLTACPYSAKGGKEFSLDLVHLQIGGVGGDQRGKVVSAQDADGRVGEQAIQLASGGALTTQGLGESERVADPPDHEGASDDIFLVSGKHLGET